jgi:hypothetical protein
VRTTPGGGNNKNVQLKKDAEAASTAPARILDLQQKCTDMITRLTRPTAKPEVITDQYQVKVAQEQQKAQQKIQKWKAGIATAQRLISTKDQLELALQGSVQRLTDIVRQAKQRLHQMIESYDLLQSSSNEAIHHAPMTSTPIALNDDEIESLFQMKPTAKPFPKRTAADLGPAVARAMEVQTVSAFNPQRFRMVLPPIDVPQDFNPDLVPEE